MSTIHAPFPRAVPRTRVFAVSGLLAALLAFGLTACDDDSQAPLADPSLEVVAQVVADATLDDVDLMRMTVPSVGAPGAALPVPGRGAVHTRTVTWYDSAGVEMDSYDDELTASIRVEQTHEIEMGRGRVTGEMTRTRDILVSGLLGIETERVFDGLGTDDRSRVQERQDDDPRTWDYEATVTIDSVVVAVDREAFPWPLAGTITRVVTIEIVNGPQGDVTRTRTWVLTFDGTQYPTLEVDGNEFEIDLDARDDRAAARLSRRSGAP